MEPFVANVVLPAAVAALVSLAVNIALGGPLEVRKLRSVRRFDSQVALLESLRLQINAVRLLRSNQRSWESRDGHITRFTDSFDATAQQLEEHYRRAIPELAALDRQLLEATVGKAMLFAGIHVSRVRHFRQEAIGYEEGALQAHTGAMIEDLATATTLLETAQRCFDPGWLNRRRALRRLTRKLVETEHQAGRDETPRTPLNYYVAQQQTTGTRPHRTPTGT